MFAQPKGAKVERAKCRSDSHLTKHKTHVLQKKSLDKLPQTATTNLMRKTRRNVRNAWPRLQQQSSSRIKRTCSISSSNSNSSSNLFRNLRRFSNSSNSKQLRYSRRSSWRLRYISNMRNIKWRYTPRICHPLFLSHAIHSGSAATNHATPTTTPTPTKK